MSEVTLGVRLSMDTRPPVIVVSGLPRSGTSLVMQMLEAGGVEIVTDGERTADDDNPRGYYEFERVKSLRGDKSWLDGARGKAVKVIHLLLMELPTDREYRVLFLKRDIGEVLKSQAKMLERSGKSGAALPAERLAEIYRGQLAGVMAWLGAREYFKVLELEHADLLSSPAESAERIGAFLGLPLEVGAMAGVVDPTLYRNRSRG